MKIDVKQVAKLANLPLSAAEEEKYSEQLSKILDYIDQLNSVDTPGEATYNVSGQENVLAPDEVSPSLNQKKALVFVTKGVFEQ